jgi:uncharacterized membrane protein HdeD (DUF308 family)
MKNKLTLIAQLIALLAFFALISKYFVNYKPEVLLFITKFFYASLGVSYILLGVKDDDKIGKVGQIIAGSYLIVMNFIPKTEMVISIGIACLILPMVYRFFKIRKEEKEFE